MDTNLAIICALTFIINLIGTLAYSVRIAGVRTRRIAVSFALFNILVLGSRTLSSIVNGVATSLMLVVIDPQLSVMTDDVFEGRVSESSFRRMIVWLVGSRFAGTVLAQALLIPTTSLILFVEERL